MWLIINNKWGISSSIKSKWKIIVYVSRWYLYGQSVKVKLRRVNEKPAPVHELTCLTSILTGRHLRPVARSSVCAESWRRSKLRLTMAVLHPCLQISHYVWYLEHKVTNTLQHGKRYLETILKFFHIFYPGFLLYNPSFLSYS